MEDTGKKKAWLGIDPGREKCGLALVADDHSTLKLDVCPARRLVQAVGELLGETPELTILLGDGTGHRTVKPALEEAFPNTPLLMVSERHSSEEAREMYFSDHPPRGILRLVPRGLLKPGKLIDAYAAKAIVFRHLNAIKKDGNGV